MLGGRHRHARVPEKDADVDVWLGHRQALEEVADPVVLLAGAIGTRIKEGLRFEGLVEQVNGPASLAHRNLGGLEVAFHIDEQLSPPRAGHPRAGFTISKQQSGLPSDQSKAHSTWVLGCSDRLFHLADGVAGQLLADLAQKHR